MQESKCISEQTYFCYEVCYIDGEISTMWMDGTREMLIFVKMDYVVFYNEEDIDDLIVALDALIYLVKHHYRIKLGFYGRCVKELNF